MHAPLPSPARVALHADGTLEGYASLFGEVDASRDMVMPGAFTFTLQQRGLRKIPMLFQHDPSEPVGIWLELREDLRGLYARGRLIPDVMRARELLALVKAGAIDGLSIGYRTVRAKIDPKTRVRKLYQVDLWEISVVTFPLLAGARVHAVKQGAVGGSGDRLARHSAASSPPRLSPQRTRAEAAWSGVAGARPGASGAADVTAPLVLRETRRRMRVSPRAGA